MGFFDYPSPIIVIVGPTGSGKTHLGISLAKILGGEIVSADSRLVYRGMNIGTAKPTPEEMRSVPHHMIDIIDPDQTYNLAQFCRQAKTDIEHIHNKKSLPILVGGTGQYVHAIVENWQSPQQKPNSILRRLLTDAAEIVGGQGLHQRLKLIDPQAAALIDAKNIRRTVRAMEVTLLSGIRFSEQRIKGAPDYSTIIFGIQIDRKNLYEKVDKRLDDMLLNGLVEEVKNLIRTYDPHSLAFEAIGYRQIIHYLEGESSLDEAIARIRQLTHQFVRRQSNWFRADDPRIHWVDFSSNYLNEILRIMTVRENWQIKTEGNNS